jgi:hypothetical protein
MTQDTYSHTYWKPFAIFDPDTQSLRMFEDTLISDLTPFSATLPQSGMMRSGVLFELPKSERLTREPDFISLPTPLASDAENPLKLRNQNNVTKQLRMLPTPTVSDTFTGSLKSSQQKEGSMHSVTLPQAAKMDWSQFEPAITRWEKLIGRKAPIPLIEQRLNPEFTEWMMGLPEGWITDLDLSWTQKIKACGNGVVPQAAAEALSRLT